MASEPSPALPSGMAMFNSALGTRDHPSLRIAMDRVEVYQVSTRGLLRGNLLITNRPRNRRVAEEKYDAADSQLPDKDLDDKQDAFARVVSVVNDERK
jgi:hypothetical protein